MNCQDFEINIFCMARAQLLEASARRQTIAHIAECPACADKLAEQQVVTAAVNATTKSLRYEEASAHVEQSLRAAFRKQAKTVAAVRSIPIRTRQWPKRTFAAMAAMVLLLLLAGAIRQWGLGDQRQKLAEAQPSPIVIPANDLNQSFPASVPEQKIVRQVANERRQFRQPVRKTATGIEESLTDFIALANENELVPLESGQVLRVELPASTLISMGLPITAEDVSKPILADLLVGQDGMARAIRFVRSGETVDAGSPQQSNDK